MCVCLCVRACVRACVCECVRVRASGVCVCVRERERERERPCTRNKMSMLNGQGLKMNVARPQTKDKSSLLCTSSLVEVPVNKIQVGWRENSNSKTLFYKDCSLGSVKNLSNN